MAAKDSAVFFPNAAAFRRWLQKHHASSSELLVGFHKRSTKRPSMTWSDSVDEALCFGWIDGLRKRVDDECYTIRFSPRKPSSIWSKLNVEKVRALEAAGKMTEAGRRAYAKRKQNRSGIYSYENRPQKLPARYRVVLDANPKAARDFDARSPSYRRAAVWWVVSAKQEETRQRRLKQLSAHHAKGELIPQFLPKRK